MSFVSIHPPRKTEPPVADYDSAVAWVRRFDIPRSPVDERGQSHSLECFRRNIRIIDKDNEEDTVVCPHRLAIGEDNLCLPEADQKT